jgi:two-component system, LytTR family, sensor kinase
MATAWLDPARDARGRLLPVEAGSSRASRSARTRALVWLTLAFWLSNFLLLNLGTALSGNPHFAGIMGMRALALIFGLLLCFVIHRVLNRPSLASLRKRIIALALMAPVAAESYAWVNFFAEMAVDPSVGFGNVTWPAVVRAISFWTWFFLAWAGLYLALVYSFDVQEERQRVAELQTQAHAAQLRALHSQINPHFLFNSLNSVSALILDGKAGEADAMVSKLSQFLRMGLAVDPGEKLPLARELALQRAYLEIERLRYPDLAVEIALPPELENALVPSLILQPIVENAVKYGVAGSPPPTRIGIAAAQAQGKLRIEVTDNGTGSGPPAAGAGIGLRHIAERLRLLYGGEAALVHGALPAGGYRVRLTLPVERT